jgi:hypothetical protein
MGSEQRIDVASRASADCSQSAEAGRTALWKSVDDFLERASLPGILAHKLGPLAANRLRRLGEPLPEILSIEERGASLCMLTAVPIVEQVRANTEGPVLLHKGPELAKIYPAQARRFRDVDVLVRDAAAVHNALLARGFVKTHDPMYDIFGAEHALKSLRLPPLGLKLEVHSSLHWPDYLPKPPLREVFEAAVPSALGVEGVSAPAPTHHALMLAAHAWAHGGHETLWRLRDLIDIAAVTSGQDRSELERQAGRWGIGRLWRTTAAAIDALLYNGDETFALRLWGRHLIDVREQRRYERHLCRLTAPYWVASPYGATKEALRGLRFIVGPDPSETWRGKLRRIPRALRNVRAPLGPSGRDSAMDRRDRTPD